MKKVFTLLFVGFFMLFGQVNGQSIQENGKLSVQGVYLVNQNNQKTQLRGMSFGWHNWWPEFYTEKTVDWLVSDWKCDIVRAAMGVGPDSSYIQMPEWAVQTISQVIESAIENDIYVIIDWHSHSLYPEQAKDFFGEMARKYGDNPHVLYEIFNEPVRDSWKDVKAYSEEIIKEIRKYDPDNIILVGSPHWCQDIHHVARDPLVGYENIMYTMHFYAATHKKWLRKRTDEAIAKGIPIFVSEYGACKADGDGRINRIGWKAWLKWMDKNHISWCKWSIADKNETCSALVPGAPTKGGWKVNQLSRSGKLSRKVLRKYSKTP